MSRLLVISLFGLAYAAAAAADPTGNPPASAAATQKNPNAIAAAGWSLDIEAAFSYYDQIKSLQAEKPAHISATPAVTQGEARTPGLRRLALTSSWMPRQNVKFSFVLRPDASIREKKDATSVVRELDTRAGETLQPMPEVKLLDAYTLSYGQPDRSQLALGAFTTMFEPRTAFNPILDFGLILFLPHKFLGFGAGWNYLMAPGTNLNEPFQNYLKPQVFVFEGTEDKGDQIRREEGKFDEGLMAKDPQRGFGFTLEYGVGGHSQFALLGAYEEQGLQIGKEKRTYGALFLYHEREKPWHGIKLSGDYRFIQSAVQGTTENRATLVQHSAQLLGMMALVEEHSVGARFSYGLGQRADVNKPTEIVSIRGYSWDLVYSHEPIPGTEIMIQLTEEMRENKFDGKTADGFSSGSEATRRIHRIGLELRQVINGSNIL